MTMFKRLRQTTIPKGPSLRIVMIGKSGVGKSALGNTILGRNAFESRPTANSVTSICRKEKINDTREICVIDTPGILNTSKTTESIKNEIVKCILVSSPGPHVFLLVLQIGRFTIQEQNAVRGLQEIFGDEASKYMIVVFTHGDALREMSIQEYLQAVHFNVRKLIESCGGRYVVFNNKNMKDREQVRNLIVKIEMVSVNGGSYFSQEMYKEAEQKIQEQKIARELAECQAYEFNFLPILHQRILAFQQLLMNELDLPQNEPYQTQNELSKTREELDQNQNDLDPTQ